jgi:DNA-nicking Smr family endonuclease
MARDWVAQPHEPVLKHKVQVWLAQRDEVLAIAKRALRMAVAVRQ